MNSYSALANIYDTFSHNDCDYESWSQYLFDIAKMGKVTSVVDIACGTGKMTQLLAKQGFRVVGVDNSPQMLAVAGQKCRAVFVQQDMKKLALPSRVDMAVCVNDGVNYLKPNQLQGFFCQVLQNLKTGASFVFDVSSPYKLQQILGNNVFYDDREDVTLLWTNKLSPTHVDFSITIFQKQGDVYVRSDEQHTQYIHTPQSIVDALLQSGFCDIVQTADYGKQISPTSQRLTFWCKKA